MSESRLKKETLRWVSKKLAEDEIAILDAGVQVSECQEAGLKRFVVRLAINRIGRRNVLAKHKKQGRPPEYGKRITSVASQSQGRGGDNRCRQTRYAIQL